MNGAFIGLYAVMGGMMLMLAPLVAARLPKGWSIAEVRSALQRAWPVTEDDKKFADLFSQMDKEDK